MTEDEFRALLAIEGKKLKVEKLNQASLYYVAVIESEVENNDPRFAVGKTHKDAVRNIIRHYYADNR